MKSKTICRSDCMYRQKNYEQLKLDMPFGIALNKENRWVKLAALFPWEEIDEQYCANFSGAEGQVAKPARLAFGSLYIQASEGYTDEQTRRNIQENPYLQYFCGFEQYTMESPFDASMMTYFRKRISADMIQKINDSVFCVKALSMEDNPSEEADEEADDAEGVEKNCRTADDTGSSNVPTTENRGTLILDATCCPADIHYPTDIGLLNQSRELAEEAIDQLYEVIKSQYAMKPRTYRKNARKEYLAYSKKRKHTAKETRRCVHRSLLYLQRDIAHLENLVESGAPLRVLGNTLYHKTLIIQEICRQQWEMYNQKSNRVDDRIVSIKQPHVRPIVRGKAGCTVEFGAKITIGLVGGYAFLEETGWDNYAEAKVLIRAAEQYRGRFGHYPARILGDRAYPVLENKKWCKEHGIRLSGPRMGRKSAEEKEEESKQIYQDSCERVAVEGTFGVCKRRYSLDRVMTKLPDTSMTSIAMGFFTANMERFLRLLFAPQINWALDYDFDLMSLIVFPCIPICIVIQ